MSHNNLRCMYWIFCSYNVILDGCFERCSLLLVLFISNLKNGELARIHPKYGIPGFSLQFPKELSYGYLRFKGNRKIPSLKIVKTYPAHIQLQESFCCFLVEWQIEVGPRVQHKLSWLHHFACTMLYQIPTGAIQGQNQWT